MRKLIPRPLAFVFFVAAFISGCSPPASEQTETELAEVKTKQEEELKAARENAVADLESQTYQQVYGTQQCTEDCSGHDAGFKWAQDNQVTDPDDCSGNSESFIEGCKAYGSAIEWEAHAQMEPKEE